MSVIEINDTSLRIEDVLEKDGVYPTVTSGTSMRPLFKTHRDMLILERVSGTLKKYDVALYRIGDKYILHRVIGVDKEKKVYIIRGDNTFTKEYVRFDSVLARLTVFKRNGKHHTVNDRSYIVYSVLWNFIYPIRYLINLGVRAVRKIYRIIFRSNKSDKKI